MNITSQKLKGACVLRSFSWANYGEDHYYGTLFFGFTTHKLTYILTKKECIKLNKKERTSSYKPGHISTRFFGQEALIQEAIKVYKEKFPNAKLLYHADEGKIIHFKK